MEEKPQGERASSRTILSAGRAFGVVRRARDAALRAMRATGARIAPERGVFRRRWSAIVREFAAYARARKAEALAALGVTTVLVIAGWGVDRYVQAETVTLYDVVVDGEVLGTVSSPDVVKDWLESRLARESHALGGLKTVVTNTIDFEQKRLFRGTSDDADVLGALGARLDFKVEAAKMIVNGKTIGYVKNVAAGEALVSRIAARVSRQPLVYDARARTVKIARLSAPRADDADQPVAASGRTGDESLIQARLKSDVRFEPELIDPSAIDDEQALENQLLTGEKEPQIYVIQEGDTLSGIAARFNMKIADLLALNPGLTPETILMIGQQLVVSPTKPELVVETETTKTVRLTVPYTTRTIEDASMYKGERKVRQAGRDGTKEVTYRLKRENGTVVEQEVVDEQIIDPPVEAIIVVGTKAPPTVPTGRFLWPTKGGYITSGFGSRRGGFHSGIDISGVADRSIMAADNGTVSFAGWDGGYGNLVIIDHGNGYSTRYGHLAQITVSDGQKVAKGQKIGVMGATGDATGVHLHFEIRKNGQAVNPAQIFDR
ncbi:MAG: M23 family metallopeptidase [Hydrogenibacillus sp.]|nr:M23 family metallopeptidase [Hydrogenibacillus sp.]